MVELDSNGERNKWRVMVVLFVLGVVIVIGTSFALWQIVLYQTDKNVITTSCLKLNFNEKTDAIVLDKVYPLSDADGKKLVPFTFEIENVCDAATSYVVNLEALGGSEKVLPGRYVKANLVKSNSEVFNLGGI